MGALIFPAMGAGISAGVILLFLSHIAPRVGAGNFVRAVDRPVVFGKSVTKREAHLAGILIHVIFSLAFGGLYGVLVGLGLASGFHLIPILGWAIILTLIHGGIVLPLEGHGLFGTKEDAWFPVDLFLTNILWAILFWWLIRLWFGFAI